MWTFFFQSAKKGLLKDISRIFCASLGKNEIVIIETPNRCSDSEFHEEYVPFSIYTQFSDIIVSSQLA